MCNGEEGSMHCYLEEEKLRILVKEFGSPLYIFHADEFDKNYRELLNCMREIYPKYNIAYSYKTNYTPKVCQRVKQLGGVSEMEYQLAKRLGYDEKDIVYNGPIKGEGLFEHLKNGGVANVDSIDEMNSVIAFAKSHSSLCVRIAFRVNIDIGQGFISRFGLDAYETENADMSSELRSAFEVAKRQENIKVVGLHCHIGRSRSLEAWEKRVRIMFKLIDRYFDAVPEFIDFGSGMNSVMEPELACQFSETVPSFQEYAMIVAGAMRERYGMLPADVQPNLYTEPGTTLISGCVTFIGTVKTMKNVKGKDYVTFDCSGGNLGDICHLKQLPISVYPMGGEKKNLKSATFVGYTCLEHDHIYEGFNGELAVGDMVQFRNVGSYSNVFKPPFILPNCAMIQLEKNGEAELIKRAETMEDIFQTYVF